MINYIDENEVKNSELMKELDGLNMSIAVLYIVAISVLLTFMFLKSEKIRVTDQINDIPNAENRPKLNYLPKLSNKLVILTLAISIKNNLVSLNTLLTLDDSERNRKDIKAAKNALIASVLGFIAALLVYENLSNEIDTIISGLKGLPI